MKGKLVFYLFLFLNNFSFATNNLVLTDSTVVKPSVNFGNLTPNQFQHSLARLDKKFPSNIVMTNEQLLRFTHYSLKKEFPEHYPTVRDKIDVAAVFDQIQKQNSWVDTFRNEDIQTLPIGIKYDNDDGGLGIELGLVKATVTKAHIAFTAFARLTLPQTDETGQRIELFFAADELKMTHSGGIIGDANLVLLGDVHIPWNNGKWLLSLKGSFNYRNHGIQNFTYFRMDCDGLKELGIQGEVQFSRDLIVPVDANGKALPKTRPYNTPDGSTITIPNRVSGKFGMIINDWNDLIAEVNISPFVLASMPESFVFAANKAIFDFSDKRTLHNNFPAFYQENGLLFPSVESWRGLYVESLYIGMPEPFRSKESIKKKQRVSFEAHHMIIDEYGVSGYFSVNNIIPLSEGRTGKKKGWAMSVDNLTTEIAANKLLSAQFDGRIILPLTDNEKRSRSDKELGIGYSGFISENEYALSMSNLDTLRFDVWKAKARLLPNSTIELAVKDKEFRPRAVLHGDLTINTNLGSKPETSGANDSKKKSSITFEGIEFKNLILQTESPVFQVGEFGYKGEFNLMNFPVSVANMTLTANDHTASLAFDLRLNLMESADKGFAADTRLEIIGSIRDEDYKQKWKFERVDLQKIYLKAVMGGFRMEGGLEIMEDDPEYGDGFDANLIVQFDNLLAKGLTVSTRAIFGKKDFKYWYYDAMVDNLPTGNSPLLGVKGFGGGASYRMTREGYGSKYSPSGIRYVPDKNSRLGLKAMILFSAFNERVMNGGAGFEILYNKSGGINKLGLYGEVSMMKVMEIANPIAAMTDKLKQVANDTGASKAIEKLSEKKLGKHFIDKAKNDYEATVPGTAGISAYVGIEFDFQNEALHGELETYVNIAGGVIQGREAGGRSGKAVLHLSKEDWYLHIGTPKEKQGIAFTIGPYRQETGGYFMIGNYILPSPPPPPEVSRILGVKTDVLNYMRDENAMSSGRGFAFGQDFKVDTGDLHFLAFYARFMAGAGYDIMLRDYGEAQCSNTGKQVGIDGWYANGQAYAYLQGELGIRIKLFFIKKKIPILRGGAAALLQAKAPNPIWLRGYVGGYYDLLGGMVKGKFNFKVTLGEECEFGKPTVFEGIKLISDLTPTDNANEIDVFVAPQATFSMSIGEPIIIPDDEGEKTYKVLLEKFRMTDEKGVEIKGTLDWNDMNDRATFFSEDILSPETNMTLEVEVSFQEKVDGIFQTLVIDGKKAVETEIRNFTTGDAPDHIPLHNIQYSYPVVNQVNFYKDQFSNGYIKLRRGQDYLFDDDSWKSEILIGDASGQNIEVNFGYDNASNEVRYKMPNLKKEIKYNYRMVSLPKNASRNNNIRSNRSRTKAKKLSEDNTIEVTTKTADNVSREGVIERLNYEFRTSSYATFEKKIKDIRVTDHLWNTTVTSEIVYLTSNVSQYPGFEIAELFGNSFTNDVPLVTMESDLDDTYFTTDINPILYQKYPKGSNYSFERDVTVYGFVPKKAFEVLNFYEIGLQNQSHNHLRKTTFPFYYDLPLQYHNDFKDIENKVLNDVVDGKLSGTSAQAEILNHQYLYMRQGKYRTTVFYRLPGGKATFTSPYTYKHTNSFRQ